MREIKFRAWDKKNKCWCGYSLRGFVLVDEKNKEQEVFGYYPKQNIVLMQYTGLKDKNGVEIYEGDIVMYRKKGRFSKPKVYQVYWNKAKCGWWIKSKPYSGTQRRSIIANLRLEVIGNIYENPKRR